MGRPLHGPGPDGWGFALEGELNRSGYTSICTPGALRGPAAMLERWGTIGLAEAVEPAARIAEGGFVVDERVAPYWQAPSPCPGMADMLDIAIDPTTKRLVGAADAGSDGMAIAG